MLSEPMTLYKLMILYLLKQVNVALSENMICRANTPAILP